MNLLSGPPIGNTLYKIENIVDKVIFFFFLYEVKHKNPNLNAPEYLFYSIKLGIFLFIYSNAKLEGHV